MIFTTKATLSHKHYSTSWDVCLVIFKPENNFSFKEWQFMMIEAQCFEKICKNPYSIATTSKQLLDKGEIGFYIKKASDQWLSARITKEAKIGDTVTLTWPVWHYFDSWDQSKYLFISTWSWLSPNLWIFQHLVYESNKFDTIVSLFWEKSDEYIVPQVSSILQNHNSSNVSSFYFFSQQTTTTSLPYRPWRVQSWIEEALQILESKNISVFLCWWVEMVKDTHKILINAWVEKQNITLEKR